MASGGQTDRLRDDIDDDDDGYPDEVDADGDRDAEEEDEDEDEAQRRSRDHRGNRDGSAGADGSENDDLDLENALQQRLATDEMASPLESFEVHLVNRYRARKKRMLVVDVESRTLSRCNRDEAAEPLSAGSHGSGISANAPLRKTIAITPLLALLPSETDKRKLRIYLDPQARPLEVVFPGASDRERFCKLLRQVRAASARATDGLDDGPEDAAHPAAAPARLNITCTTFNCSKQPAPSVVAAEDDPAWGAAAQDEGASTQTPHVHLSTLEQWLPSGECDVCFVSLQECKSKFLADWHLLFLNALGADQFTTLATVSMWGIHGLLFVRAPLARYFSHIRTDTRACGLGGVMGNKGAVGIAVSYGDGVSASNTTFAFVDAHLAARADRLAQRASDYQEICHSLLTRKKGFAAGLQLLHAYDHLFWAGDLNYRLDLGEHGSDLEFAAVVERVAEADDQALAQLREHDQLDRERAEHNVFVGFREGELAFPPTYRMEVGRVGVYNNKRNQNPSWTDRVLWRSRPGIPAKVELIDYMCVSAATLSDHRPVVARFSVLTESALLDAAAAADLLGSLPSSPAQSPTSFAPVRPGMEVASDDGPRFQLRTVEFCCKHVDAQQEAALKVLNDPAFLEKTRSAALSNVDDLSDNDEDDRAYSQALEEAANAGSRLSSSSSSRSRSSLHRDSGSRRGAGGSEGSAAGEISGDALLSVQALHAGSHSSRRRRPARSRQNSYYRPLRRGDGASKSRFRGYGFAGGLGKLEREGIDHCGTQSSEFTRYVCQSDIGVHSNYSRVFLRFHSSILESEPTSVPVLGCPERGYIRFNWADTMVSGLEPFVKDPNLLIDQQVVVTLYRASNFKQELVGQAQIPLRPVVENGESWFAVPVLLNGLPAGILRGNVFNTAAAAMAEAVQTRLNGRCVDLAQPLDALPSFVSIGGSQEGESVMGLDREDDAISEGYEVEFTEEDDDEDNASDCGPAQRDDESARFEAWAGRHVDDADARTVVETSDDADEAESDEHPDDKATAHEEVYAHAQDQDGEDDSGVKSDADEDAGRLKDELDSTEEGSLAADDDDVESKASAKRISWQSSGSGASIRSRAFLRVSSHLSVSSSGSASKQSPGGSARDSGDDTTQRASWLARKLQRPKRFSSSGTTDEGDSAGRDAHEQTGGRHYTYEELRSRRSDLGVDPTRLEMYLTDDDFAEVFGMSRASFKALPKWKRIHNKKKVNLF